MSTTGGRSCLSARSAEELTSGILEPMIAAGSWPLIYGHQAVMFFVDIAAV